MKLEEWANEKIKKEIEEKTEDGEKLREMKKETEMNWRKMKNEKKTDQIRPNIRIMK
jgi:hypothetical protein